MIYRVGENETNVYDQNRLKSAQTSSNGEKFNLNQYTRPDTSDTEKKETDIDEQHVRIAPGSSELKRDGVVVQLSGSASHQKSVEDTKADASRIFSFQDIRSLLDKLQHWANRFVNVLKETFYRIWNDPPAEEIVEESDKTDKTDKTGNLSKDVPEKERLTEEYKREKNVLGYEDMINTITNNGERFLAKNSTLLTYYDRNGKLIQINASDRERILHGDKNTKKL